MASPVQLRAQDGYELAGTLHAADGAQAAPRVAVVHCGAGIPASRYQNFAAFLAGAGMPTLTYDYRGIGRSRPGTLRGFAGEVEDWSEYDCTAAIAWLRARFPDAKIVGIAHSLGAWLVGGAGNAAEQARLVLIGGHTGYYGDYRPLYRLPMAVLWHAVMPAMTRLVGYFPGRRLGLGEDIPAKIALQWAARRSPQLGRAVSDRARMLLERCASLERPALVVSVSDDAFATPAGMQRLMTYYSRLFPLQHLRFTPADAGVRRIGHFGFFGRRVGAVLWPRLLAQLDAGPR
ncbi:MAG: alpha/beta fold hydrolase [Burkholderiales bacterium]